MITANYFEDNPDISFQLDHFIDWEKIVPLVENDFADAKEYKAKGNAVLELAPSNVSEALDAYRTAIEQYGEISGKEIAPRAKKMEKDGLKFANGKVTFPADMIHCVDLIAQSGLIGYSVKRKHGGLSFPVAAQMAILEMVSRADGAFGIAIGCFNLAEVIARFGSPEMIDEYVPRMTSGEWTGAMALTEPDYGSDLPNIRTRADQKPDGSWEISGTKRFITHGCGLGDRPAAILTLARTGGTGARGLSFFLVESGDVQISRIEEKMGLHISPTCEVVYEKSPAKLIGEAGKGLVKYAMEMMNGARIGIAVQALGMAQASLSEATKYADERSQFGKLIREIPAVRRLIQESDALVQAMRAMVYRTAEIVDLYDGLRAKLEAEGRDEKEVRRNEELVRYDRLAKLLTPASKLFASEKANKIAYDCQQVFGGSGFTEEYDIAKIYRDTRIAAIYEGTSQLQVIACIGNITEGMRPDGLLYSFLKEEISSTGADAPRLQAHLKDLLETAEIFRNKKDKEEKDYLAWDLTFFFIWLLCSILICRQAEIAAAKKLPRWREEKRKMADIFLKMAGPEMAAHSARVRGLS